MQAGVGVPGAAVRVVDRARDDHADDLYFMRHEPLRKGFVGEDRTRGDALGPGLVEHFCKPAVPPRGEVGAREVESHEDALWVGLHAKRLALLDDHDIVRRQDRDVVVEPCALVSDDFVPRSGRVHRLRHALLLQLPRSRRTQQVAGVDDVAGDPRPPRHVEGHLGAGGGHGQAYDGHHWRGPMAGPHDPVVPEQAIPIFLHLHFADLAALQRQVAPQHVEGRLAHPEPRARALREILSGVPIRVDGPTAREIAASLRSADEALVQKSRVARNVAPLTAWVHHGGTVLGPLPVGLQYAVVPVRVGGQLAVGGAAPLVLHGLVGETEEWPPHGQRAQDGVLLLVVDARQCAIIGRAFAVSIGRQIRLDGVVEPETTPIQQIVELLTAQGRREEERGVHGLSRGQSGALGHGELLGVRGAVLWDLVAAIEQAIVGVVAIPRGRDPLGVQMHPSLLRVPPWTAICRLKDSLGPIVALEELAVPRDVGFVRGFGLHVILRALPGLAGHGSVAKCTDQAGIT
mmetsp:Transcript_127136/g.406741  ORF Transcript_127136/g.406741 Transcript_127136/m.406741 type:complete len:517 (-) Transcript_127136:597-2147(-)